MGDLLPRRIQKVCAPALERSHRDARFNRACPAERRICPRTRAGARPSLTRSGRPAPAPLARRLALASRAPSAPALARWREQETQRLLSEPGACRPPLRCSPASRPPPPASMWATRFDIVPRAVARARARALRPGRAAGARTQAVRQHRTGCAPLALALTCASAPPAPAATPARAPARAPPAPRPRLARAVAGISASPYQDNLRYFNVVIAGPAQSPFEAGIFRLELFLPEEYPMAPPKARARRDRDAARATPPRAAPRRNAPGPRRDGQRLDATRDVTPCECWVARDARLATVAAMSGLVLRVKAATRLAGRLDGGRLRVGRGGEVGSGRTAAWRHVSMAAWLARYLATSLPRWPRARG
jgi:hypothetical protein